ncbi:MAG TPA: tetratricopeptide repeat protein [Terriglobia bacterium]|nr:tetratricopeptide repeat protein [Terriglobia bacterium]
MKSPKQSDCGTVASAIGARQTRLRSAAVLATVWGALWAGGTLVAQENTGAPSSGALDLSDPKALEQRGDLYMVRKFYPEAIGIYGQLVKLDPRNPVYQNKLGIAYHQDQNLNAAKRAYRAALRLNPRYSEALNNLAAVEYAQKNYRSAILTYLKALELSPASAVVYSNLGTAYFAYKKYEYAMSCYRYALLLDPKIFESSGRAGSIVHQRSDQDMAAFNFYLAKTYAGMQDVENTLQYLNKAWEAGYKDLSKELTDPVFAFLLEEPRFLDLVARINPEQRPAAAPVP